MTRTLRRLARIQRIRQDEAHQELRTAEQAQVAHDAELQQCHESMDLARADEADCADDLMRRHSFSLRQEMLRRRLQAHAEVLEADVDLWRTELMDAAKQVKTTERFTDLVEAKAAGHHERRTQRQLDEAGLLGWIRRSGEIA